MKEIITRKEHECFGCAEIIPKGSKAEFVKWRGSVYDGSDKQIGISYGHYYSHTFRCDLEPEIRAKCEAGEHEWEVEYEFDHYADCHRVYLPTDKDVCKHCGEKREMINEDY